MHIPRFLSFISIALCTSTMMAHSVDDKSHNYLRVNDSISLNRIGEPFIDKQYSIRRIESTRENENHEEENHDEHEHEEGSNTWLKVLGGTLLVNLATLTGVIFLIPFVGKRLKSTEGSDKTLDIVIPSFAAGALIATVIFLTMPESIALIQTMIMEQEEANEAEGEGGEHDEHGFELATGTTWRFGASVLGGFLLPVLLGAFFPHAIEHDSTEGDTEAFDLVHGDENDKAKEAVVQSSIPIDMPLALSILIGDAFHNFCDGVFVGIAFKRCDTSIAMTIIGVTLYHEIAQELADYFLLTRHAGFTKFRALFFNFLAGLSVVFGGLLVLVIDMSELTIGIILALASGVYLNIAACECLPRVSSIVSTLKERMLVMLMFTVGAIPIGLTLLNHTHCEPDSHDDH